MPSGSIILSVLQYVLNMHFVAPVLILGFLFALIFVLVRR